MPTEPHMQDPRLTLSVTISSGSALSDIVDQAGYALAGVDMSTAWTAAPITFDGGPSTAALFPLYTDTGGEIIIGSSAAVVASRGFALAPDVRRMLGSHRYLRLRSGPSTAAVNQADPRTLGLHFVPLD